MGRCYELGLGVEKNQVAAEKLYEEAVKAEFPLALFLQGDRIARKVKPGGLGVQPEEAEKAKKYLIQAFDAGVYSASVPLSRFVFYDPKADRDSIATAIKRMETAAAKDVADANFTLWVAYAKNVKNFPGKNLPKAKAYLLRGQPGGCLCPAGILAAGIGVEEAHKGAVGDERHDAISLITEHLQPANPEQHDDSPTLVKVTPTLSIRDASSNSFSTPMFVLR